MEIIAYLAVVLAVFYFAGRALEARRRKYFAALAAGFEGVSASDYEYMCHADSTDFRLSVKFRGRGSAFGLVISLPAAMTGKFDMGDPAFAEQIGLHKTVKTGDADFDSVYAVRSDTPEFVQSLLRRPEVKKLALEILLSDYRLMLGENGLSAMRLFTDFKKLDQAQVTMVLPLLVELRRAMAV